MLMSFASVRKYIDICNGYSISQSNYTPSYIKITLRGFAMAVCPRPQERRLGAKQEASPVGGGPLLAHFSTHRKKCIQNFIKQS